MDIAALTKHRGTIKAAFTRAQTFLLTVDKDTVSVQTIQNRRTLLDENFRRFEQIQQEIEDKIDDEDALNEQFCARGELEERYLELVSLCDEIISAKTVVPAISTATSSTSSSSTRATSVNVKLPAIELPTFNGNYADWTSFHDLFSATIDSRSGLSDAQKLQYLKTSVKDEAANLIRSLSITNDNYQEAWDTLKTRYHNEREIVNSILGKLFAQPHLHKESASALQKMLDTTKECLRSLKVLKRPTEHWDDLVNFHIVQRLDPESRRQWALQQKGTSLPTFKELSEFIEQHARGLQASNSSTNKHIIQRNASSSSSHHGYSEAKCSICKQVHPIYKCEIFRSASVEERSNLVRKHRLCFNCLRSDHQSQNCNSKSTCRVCKKRHNSLLHFEKSNNGNKPTAVENSNSAASGAAASFFSSGETENTQVLLHTVVAKVKDSSGNDQHVRILLDSGSQATMITEKCANALGLKRQHSRVTVSGISSSSVGQARGEVQLKLHSTVNSTSILIHALVFPKVTGILPKYTSERQRWTHLEGLTLADPSYHEPGPVDILLGADYTASIMREGHRSGEKLSPVAQNTIFGWVLCGRVNIECGYVVQSNHTHCELEKLVQRFWELEQIPNVQHLTPEEQFCEEHFWDTFQRDESGRFIVQLPINPKITQLGGSRDIAIQRWKQVERRLANKPEFKAEYVKFMQQYESLGHMELVPAAEQQEVFGKTNYLPHHFVLKTESTTTKFRVVFDASAKTTSGISLNDILCVGATVQKDLFTIQIKFRLHIIVIKTDIEKMFRQFLVIKEHSDLQRIVWRESPDQPIQDYRLLTVTYGTSPAPSLSTRCLQELAAESEAEFPESAKVLEDDTYMDDIMSGAKTIADGKVLVSELNNIANSACLTLRKWCSNNVAVLEDIPTEFREEETAFDLDKGGNIKALGVKWNTVHDHFTFNVAVEEINIITKRVMLSELAKVYDPLGLITPITVVAKMLFQELWLIPNLDWGSSVPAQVAEKWIDYRRQLKDVENIFISRCINPVTSETVELHGFSDASILAYGAVVYLRILLPNGGYQSTMITSKARVAPLKRLSIERLELCAAALLAELMIATTRALQIDCPMFAWTDSTITLRYIAGHPSRWKTFIAHKVARIHARIPNEHWRFVKGTENPADLISRGVPASKLKSLQLWWQGPVWLSSDNLPLSSQLPESKSVLEERKKALLVSHAITISSDLLHKYSSLQKLIRVTAYVFRFIKMYLKQSSPKGPLTCDELKEAETLWIQKAQKSTFHREIKCLQQQQELHRASPLRQLTPFIDGGGILRAGGRLSNSELPYDQKFPIIIPHESYLCKLIISDAHIKLLHAGCQLLWSHLQQQYWIIKSKSTIRNQIRKCIVCRRHRADKMQQLMGSLPKARVIPNPPFQNTGVDYAGPFNVRLMKGRSNKTFKAYFAIFVCMCTKAVHLEAVSDMTTEAFLAAFKRFTSRRGISTNMYSDCGSNFVGADRELQKLLTTSAHNNQMTSHLSTQGIKWHFNTPAAPHQGGLWEAGVKSVKFHLRRVVGNTTLTFEEFTTVLCQIEACPSSRPLCALSSDPNDFNPLTPGHFLIGRPLTALPEPSLLDIKVNRLNRWQLCQQMVQHFWKRWSSEYLSLLQQRFKWTEKRPNLKLNDLVLISDDELPPSRWKLGRVIELFPSIDQNVRVVNVKTMSGILKRSVQKLTPLLLVDERD